MSHHWVSEPISCERDILCAAINLDEPLIPVRTQLAFRAALLFNAWQAYACDGRQVSQDAFERMEYFDSAFADKSKNEEALRMLVTEFGQFITTFLAKTTFDIPSRALVWTRQEFERKSENPDTMNDA